MQGSSLPNDEAATLIETTIEEWLTDPESDVVYAEMVEGRWAVRMRQTVREATTVWWELGDYSLSVEAYVIPAPVGDPAPAYRLALARNHSSWRVHFAVDSEGALLLRGRLSRPSLNRRELDLALGEVYQLVEVSFRPLLALSFPGREKSP